MKIKEFEKAKYYALITCDLNLNNGRFENVEIREINAYYPSNLEDIFEDSILTDVNPSNLKDGGYICSVLVKNYWFDPDLDLEIKDCSFTKKAKTEKKFIWASGTSELPF